MPIVRHPTTLAACLVCLSGLTACGGASSSPAPTSSDVDAALDAAVEMDSAGAPVDAAPPAADGPAADGPAATPDPGCLAAVVTLGDLEIFAYEAVRSDATADAEGVAVDKACSRPGVLPWSTVTLDQARAACAASGFELCSGDDWLAACGGDAHRAFPYGGSHVPAACNDHVSGDAHVEIGGFHPDCHTPEGVYDLSGNLWEMTADGQRRGASFRINPVYYQTAAAQCDGQLTVIGDGANDENGFRCCRHR